MKHFALGFLKLVRMVLKLSLVLIILLFFLALLQAKDDFSIDETDSKNIKITYSSQIRASHPIASVDLLAYKNQLKEVYFVALIIKVLIPLIMGILIINVLIRNFEVVINEKRFEIYKLNRLKKLAIGVSVYSIIATYIEIVLITAVTGILKINVFSFNVGNFFLVGLMLYLLAEVFERGGDLQVAYDARTPVDLSLDSILLDLE